MRLEVNVPEDLGEIKLKDYQKFVKTCKDSNDEMFVKQKMIEIFCGVPLLSVLKMQFSDVEDITNHINNLFTAQPSLTRRFKLANLDFGFIPNLDKITVAEYVDLDTYIADFDTMHKAMAVLYRPVTDQRKDTYAIEEYNGSDAYSLIMEHATMDVVIGAQVFFWNLGNELLKAIPTYLEKQVDKMSTQKATNSGANGDGINQSIHLLKETLQELMPLHKRDYLKP
jgi:hypothetical protein